MSKHRLPPQQLKTDGILLGWSLEHEHARQPIGFSFNAKPNNEVPEPDILDPVLLSSGGHVATIAPTGTGKGVSAVIPNLLHYQGQAVVVDPKGENFAVTAKYRESLGQDIVLFDPFNITGSENKAGFNVLDLIPVDEEGMENLADNCLSLAKLLIEFEAKDTFWDNNALALIAAMLGYIAIDHGDKRDITRLGQLLSGTPKVILARCEQLDVRTGGLFSSYTGALKIAPPNTFSSIVTVARHQVSALCKGAASRCLKQTTFSLLDFIAGKPMTLYLVLPPDKLFSHRKLLRLWVGGILRLLLNRKGAPKHSTLMLLDEAAQLGTLEEVVQSMTLFRGYGLQLWTFWQDLDQLMHLYPSQWKTILNNCKAIQAFGFPNRLACDALTEVIGSPVGIDLLDLDRDELLLQIAGDDAVIAQKANYLSDNAFANRFAENPYHSERDAQGFVPVLPQRLYVREPAGTLPPGVSKLSPTSVLDSASKSALRNLLAEPKGKKSTKTGG